MRIVSIILLALIIGQRATARDSETYELPPFSYSATQPRDAISRLQARMATGDLKLAGTDRDIVRALMRELGIPVESQVVVFSKTSFQRQIINPDHPRAIYFSDDCYVGWVPGGLVEITSWDPLLGPIFYSLDPAAARTNAARAFVRDNDCLRCHGGAFVRGIPGVFVRSLFTDANGEPLLRHGSEVVDFRTPFTNRWGGWYVTGKHGSALHRGNVIAREKNDELVVDLKRGANVQDLAGHFETTRYLTNTSDIVALLVLEHQTAMQNTITRAALNCRRMLDYQRNLQRELKEAVTAEIKYDSVRSVFDSSAKELVDDLLFQGEAELPAGLHGSPGFQSAFAGGARRTKEGSSLKELSLAGHLFKNRCSYQIYSAAFLALPAQLKQRVYERLARILTAETPEPRFAYLPADERRRITAILRETHSELTAVLGR